MLFRCFRIPVFAKQKFQLKIIRIEAYKRNVKYIMNTKTIKLKYVYNHTKKH